MTKSGLPAWSFDVGLQNFTLKNKLVAQCSEEHRTWTYPLDKRVKWRNLNMRFGARNVRSFYTAESMVSMSFKELSKYETDLAAPNLQENSSEEE
jgi:hypothetical protein